MGLVLRWSHWVEWVSIWQLSGFIIAVQTSHFFGLVLIIWVGLFLLPLSPKENELFQLWRVIRKSYLRSFVSSLPYSAWTFCPVSMSIFSAHLSIQPKIHQVKASSLPYDFWDLSWILTWRIQIALKSRIATYKNEWIGLTFCLISSSSST
jgi:hypothetical protein